MSDASSSALPPGAKLENPKKNAWGGWYALAASFLIVIGSQSAALILVNRANLEGTVGNSVLFGIAGLFAILGVAVAIRFTGVSFRKFLGEFRWMSLLVAGFLFVVYVQLASIVFRLGEVLFKLNVDQEQDLGLGSSFSLMEGLLVFFALAVITPIAEELLYRGLLYRGLRRTFGRIAGAIITSLLFGFLHGQWNVAVDTFVLSLLLIIGLEWQKNLWTPIVLHGLKNSFAVLAVLSIL